MIEINLIPDVKREYLRTRSMRNFVISAAVLVTLAAVAVCVVLGLILGGQLVAGSLQDNAIKTENQTLTEVSDLNKAVTIQQQLEAIGQQHQAKRVTSRLFDVLAAINPPAPNNVRISNLRMDPTEKTITIEGSAINGYTALEVFKKTITNTTIQIASDENQTPIQLTDSIQDGETSLGENADGQRVLRFSFSFVYPDELFAVSQQPVTVVTPTGRKDVTDSRLGVPESIFESSNTNGGEQ